MSECYHIWCLDAGLYFERLDNHLRYRDREEIVFPAKCGVCPEVGEFNEMEWMEAVKRVEYNPL